MSATLSAATWAAIGAIAAVGTSVYSADQQRSNANRANDIARANAKKNQQLTEEATNRANAKKPDIGALLAANMLSAKAGNASTMLTGPTGIDASQLTLGKNSLLGS